VPIADCAMTNAVNASHPGPYQTEACRDVEHLPVVRTMFGDGEYPAKVILRAALTADAARRERANA
jgi:hypothetical protein